MIQAVENLVQRSQKTTAALLLDEARPLLVSLLLSPTRPTLRVAAVGGGPGFEAVGLAALAEFLCVGVEVECLSMDIEPGWGAVLGAVVGGTCDPAGMPCCAVVAPESLRAAPAKPEPGPEPEAASKAAGPRHRIAFVASDCLTGHAGPDLLEAAPAIDLFTFNYVLVENARALRTDKFAYLRQVFSAAPMGCVFCFMVRRVDTRFRYSFWHILASHLAYLRSNLAQDAAYHMWAEVVEVFAELGSDGTILGHFGHFFGDFLFFQSQSKRLFLTDSFLVKCGV